MVKGTVNGINDKEITGTSGINDKEVSGASGVNYKEVTGMSETQSHKGTQSQMDGSGIDGDLERSFKGTQSRMVEWMGEMIDLEWNVSEEEITTDECECVDEWEKWKIENWEHYGETSEGQDPSFWLEDSREETKVRKIKPNLMKKIRRLEWARKTEITKFEEEDRVLEVNEVLEEDIQEYEK